MSTARELSLHIYRFLEQPHMVRIMRQFSDRGRPAVEAVGGLLLAEFGEAIAEDPVKQKTGKIVKDILQANGYVHRSYGHKTPDCPLFRSGSLYSIREAI